MIFGIKKISEECLKDNVAYHGYTLYLFGIPLYNAIETTTDKEIIVRLKSEKHIKVKGYAGN